MPQETKSKAEVGANESPSLQGLIATREDREALLEALEHAFDYRGDVSLTLDDGEQIAGYIFDRARGAGLEDSYVRLLHAKSGERVVVAFSRIDRVEFSGRDAAAGKSFETWIKKYAEKKLAGQEASLYTDDESNQAPDEAS